MDFLILLLFLNAFFYAIIMVLNRFFTTKYFKHPVTYQILQSLNAIPFILIFPFFYQIVWSLDHLLIGAAFGFITSFTFILWYFSVREEEVSIVGPLTATTPLFVVLIAALFIGEILNLFQIFAILLLVAAGILITYSSKTKLKLTKSLMAVLLFIVLTAAASVFVKYFVTDFDPLSFLFYVELGAPLATITLLLKKDWRNYFIKKDLKKPLWAVLFSCLGMGVFFFSSLGIFYYVVSQMSVSVANAISNALIPVFILIISFIITQINPKWLNERFDKKTATLKIVGVLLLSVGIYLLVM